MTRYLISFEDGTMVIPEAELPAVADAAHAVLREAKDAGVYLTGGGVDYAAPTSVVAIDGTTTHGPMPARSERIGGFVVLDCASRDDALAWAAKFAAACRCSQEVRALMDDPEA